MTRQSWILGLVLAVGLGPLGARADHGDATGIDDETIYLGLHVPLTGAAPVEPMALSDGMNLYWRYLHDDLGILVHDRRVEVRLRDDNHTPSTAVSVCNELAQDSFLLLGFTGTDQIRACAQYASPRAIPYLAPGHQETQMHDAQTFYALSASWVAQGPIIAEYILNVLGEDADRVGGSGTGGEDPECEPILVVPILDIPVPLYRCTDPDPGPQPDPRPDGVIRVGLVRSNTPNHNDADEALRDALEGTGVEYRHYTVVKEGTPQEAQNLAVRMQQDGIDVVVTLTSSPFTVALSFATGRNGYYPLYLLYGMTSGYNSVASLSCREGAGLHGAAAFSPWPGWRDVNAGDFDPHFAIAAEKYAAGSNTPAQGDWLLALWGLMKNVHLMLDALGEHPTRQDLLAMLDGGYEHSTGVYPDLAVSAEDRFGVDAVHRLEVDCTEEDPTLRQRDAFVTGYPAEDAD